MKVSDWFDYQTPTGSKGNLLNPKDFIAGIMGVVALIMFMAMGKQVAEKIDNVIPGNQTKVGYFTQATATETKKGSVVI